MKKSFLNFLLFVFIVFSFSACVGSDGPTYEFIDVVFGDLDQVVSATGYLQPQERVHLAMEISGKIEDVLFDVGDEVKKGDLLVKLDDSDVAMQLSQAQAGIASSQAQLKQSEASLKIQQALLSDLENGSSEENLKVAETAVANAEKSLLDLQKEIDNTMTLNEETLANLYAGTISALEKSLTVARNSLYTFTDLQYTYFSNSTMTSILVMDAKAKVALSLLGAKDAGRWVSKYLHEYCEGTCALVLSLRENDDVLLVDQALEQMLVALQDLKAAYFVIPMDSTLNTTDKSTVNSEKTALDLEISALSAKKESIALQKVSNNNALTSVENRYNTALNNLETAKANLSLVQAGSTESQIAAQVAAVEQAEAALMMQAALLDQSRAAYDSLVLNLNKYELRAPFDGIITAQNAKVGEIAAPQGNLLSLMTNNEFEIEASIRETDIDKLKLANKVELEFDALPGEKFLGELIFINPAENVQQGVIYYDIKINLAEENLNINRLKSGMTADLNIISAQEKNILYLPMGVITYTGGRAYVDILIDGEVVEEEIQTGIESAGYVQVINNLQAGDKVISAIIE